MKADLSMLPPGARAHLAAFKQEVERALPGRVAGMALFGSRARGEAEDDSDYDVAVFVRDLSDHPTVREIVSDIAYPHILEGIYISAIVLSQDYLHKPRGRTALAEDIAKDGIALS